MSLPYMRATSALFGLVVLAILLVPLGLSLWLDARWFAAQNLSAIFALRIQTQIGLGVAAAILAAALTALNLAAAAWLLRRTASKEDRESRGMATLVAAVPLASVIVGAAFGLAAFGQWQTWLGFQAQVPFGETDPTYGQDVAFYVWTLPALAAARGWVTGLVIANAIGVALIYALGLASVEPPVTAGRPYPFIARERNLRFHPLLAPAVRHLAVLGAVFLSLIAGSYWLNNWELVYSARGVVFGASATDMHAIYFCSAKSGRACTSRSRSAPISWPPNGRISRTTSLRRARRWTSPGSMSESSRVMAPSMLAFWRGISRHSQMCGLPTGGRCWQRSISCSASASTTNSATWTSIATT
jgi:uncharacterized membrane protein (UPF0182 family)